MKAFFILEKKDEKNLEKRIIPIKDGFNFFAGVFQFLWALYNKLFYAFVIIGLIHVIYALAIYFLKIDEWVITVIDIAIIVLIGYLASDWQMNYYLRKGYKIKNIVMAYDVDHAMQRYMDNLANNKIENYVL